MTLSFRQKIAKTVDLIVTSPEYQRWAKRRRRGAARALDLDDNRFVKRVLRNEIRLCERCDDFLSTRRSRFCGPCQAREVEELRGRGWGSDRIAAHLGMAEASFIACQNRRRREAAGKNS